MKLITESTIYRKDKAYSSFPHIILDANGDLLVAFRSAGEFSYEAAINGVATHHDPDSRILMVRSSDQGATWSDPEVVYDGPFGVNDPALTLTRDGRLLCRFVALRIRPTGEYRFSPNTKIFSHRSEHGLVAEVVGNFVLEKIDSGDWSYVGVTDCEQTGPSCSRDPMVELQDGSLLMPVYTGAPQRSDVSWCIRSFDGGQTWGSASIIMEDERGVTSQMRGTNFNETSILDFGDGSLLAVARGDTTFQTDSGFMPVGGVGKLYSSRSHDGGLCWSPVMETGIWGQPGSLILTSDSRVFCTHGHRRSPYGVQVVVSKDQGFTWDVDSPYVISDDSSTWDCGYPFTVEISSGTFASVFYTTEPDLTRTVKCKVWREA